MQLQPMHKLVHELKLCAPNVAGQQNTQVNRQPAKAQQEGQSLCTPQKQQTLGVYQPCAADSVFTLVDAQSCCALFDNLFCRNKL